MEPIRLQKYLASQGIASRRKIEQFIQQGRIKVNGMVVTNLGTKIQPDIDEIWFEGKKVEYKNEEKIYVLLNKPIGYVTTVEDQFSRATVLDLVKGVKQRVVPVGRLDMYTSGALLLSNDGEFVYRITHPKYEIEKTYLVTVKGNLEISQIQALQKGVKIEDYITKPAKVKVLKKDEIRGLVKLEITIHEGKNREVRKMCEAVGTKVLALHRSKIGTIDVKNLEIGTWRYLTKEEVLALSKKR